MQVNKLRNLIEQNKSGAGELAIVEGLHAVKHALRFGAKAEYILTKNKGEVLALSQKLCPDISGQLEKEALETGEDFNKITNSIIRTGVIGVFRKPDDDVIQGIAKDPVNIKSPAVLLDDPRDLDNIGAALRVCAAANIKSLLITGSSNPWNSKSIRAAAGLQFALKIHNVNIEEVKAFNIPITCFDERGEELTEKLKQKLPPQAIYVFGSERDGISEELKSISDKIVRLPMQEKVSSMNLATSVAAALYSLK
jgi:RNA methyltransferase, TrmH family